VGLRQNLENLEKVLQDDTQEAEEHIKAAWKYLHGAEGADDPES